MVRPDFLEMFDAKAVVKQEAQRFSTNALVPKGFCDPIAHLAIALADGNVTGGVGEIADTAHDVIRFFPNNCPSGFVGKDAADDLTALLNRAMSFPAGAGSYVRIGSNFEKLFRITLLPTAEEKTLGVQYFIFHFLRLNFFQSLAAYVLGIQVCCLQHGG